MKNRYIIFSIFLVLGLVVITVSLYISKQSFKEILKEEKKPVKSVLRQVPAPPTITEQRKEAIEAKKQKESLELEFDDLEKVPDEYIKDVESKVAEEEKEVIVGERKLNKEPTSKELKELKTKGVIIY